LSRFLLLPEDEDPDECCIGGLRVAAAGRGNDRDRDSCKRGCAADEVPAGAFDRTHDSGIMHYRVFIDDEAVMVRLAAGPY
jgi:hypothetical protein